MAFLNNIFAHLCNLSFIFVRKYSPKPSTLTKTGRCNNVLSVLRGKVTIVHKHLVLANIDCP